MCLSPTPDRADSACRTPGHIDDEPREQVARLAFVHDDGGMRAARYRHRREAATAVTYHQLRRRQIGLGSTIDGLGREATGAAELDEFRAPLVLERHGRYARRFVLRTASRLAAEVLATQVSVVELDGSVKFVLPLALGHDVVDLMLPGPGGGVAHAELALERQRRQSCLGLAGQTDSQKPGALWQLGMLKQAAHGERGLVEANQALKEFVSAAADHDVLGSGGSRAAKAAGPPHGLDGLGALILVPKCLKKSGSDMPVWNWVNLNAMTSTLVGEDVKAIGQIAHKMSCLRRITNQVFE